MSYATLGGDTSYHGSHSRSHSETRAGADRDALIGNNPSTDDLYDPHTRTGRPSFARSAQNSPMMNPTIQVQEPEKLNLERGFGDGNQLPARPQKPSGWAVFLARIRFVLITVLLVASFAVVGVNAAIMVTYNKHRDTIKWNDRFGRVDKEPWPVWPLEGVDTRPITAYLAVGSVNAIVAIGLILLSLRKSFRYAEGICTEISLAVVSLAFCVLWILLAVFLQYQALGHSNHHSFLTWSCTHTGSMFAVESFSFANLCNLSRAGRITGLISGGANFLILATIIMGCCTNRKTRGYAPVANGSWMPRWGRIRK